MIEERFDATDIGYTAQEGKPATDDTPATEPIVELRFTAGLPVAGPNGLPIPCKMYVTAVDPATAIQFAEDLADAARQLLGDVSGKLAVVKDLAGAEAAAARAAAADGQLRG